MSDWREEIERAIADFETVARLAGDPVASTDLRTEFLTSPHQSPKSLPIGLMAVYGFWGDGCWLKIGKAGPNSNARYTSQHYNAGSANSNLAKSLASDTRMSAIAAFDRATPGMWIRATTHRVNILMPATRHKELLSLLEAFLHLRLKPRYEG